MNVLREILQWSTARPEWQRDALRRLVTQPQIEESDVSELTTICKAAHGLAERVTVTPLEAQHIRSRRAQHSAVTLDSITHHRGVNALAKDQKLEFGPALTIVYGANAAGKSGFTRILKRACRARGAEEILGNVLSGALPSPPSATISFAVGTKSQQLVWTDQKTHEALGQVSVFDSQSAAVYLREKTDVAFRPFGLDIFDKLADLCEQIRKNLERERRELENARPTLPLLHEDTAVHRALSNITSLTNPKTIKELARLSETETERIKEIQKTLRDLQAEDPAKAARILTLRSQRLESVRAKLQGVQTALADSKLISLFEARDQLHQAHVTAESVRRRTFPDGLLNGTGSSLWRRLWESARDFSTGSAYPNRDFPVTGDNAHCVLCQQPLSSKATERLDRFEEAVNSTAQRDLDNLQRIYNEALAGFESLAVLDDSVLAGVEELRVESEDLAKTITTQFEHAQQRKDTAVLALKDGEPLPTALPAFAGNGHSVATIQTALQTRASHLLSNKHAEIKATLTKELREFEARTTLNKALDAVLGEIERKKKIAAYELCLRDTNTAQITRKSTEVTTQAVTQQLADSFTDELRKLRFTHLEVELQPAGGVRGALYHRLVLKRAPGTDLPRVVSEGEARCLSIAAFFSELSTASDDSAVLFDDPVSSLDHEWRENVGRRLADEAQKRQVVVFTHDIVFLLALVKFAEELSADCKHQHLRREGAGSGVSSPELPWVAMKVKNRIGVLKNQWQKADKLFRQGARDEYEQDALLIYGRLRETWERGLEEVLLGGVVERYRPSVQTQQAKHLSDITADDCKVLEGGMTKCSRWLPGHDQSPAENVAVPEPEELKADIEEIEGWMQTIQKRRK
jgi:energy-coupling factor transporter ATP-binding protein EcfA2